MESLILDHALSLLPKEFKLLVELGTNIYKTLNTINKLS